MIGVQVYKKTDFLNLGMMVAEISLQKHEAQACIVMFGRPHHAASQSGPESDHAKLGKERARHHVPEQRRRAPRRRESLPPAGSSGGKGSEHPRPTTLQLSC